MIASAHIMGVKFRFSVKLFLCLEITLLKAEKYIGRKNCEEKIDEVKKNWNDLTLNKKR